MSDLAICGEEECEVDGEMEEEVLWLMEQGSIPLPVTFSLHCSVFKSTRCQGPKMLEVEWSDMLSNIKI